VVAGPGKVVHGPKNVPHTEWVSSSGVEVNAPAGLGFEKFIVAAGQPAAELTLPPSDQPPPDLERLIALAAEHDIEVLGPPGSLP
jgi:hypothetical protein